MRNSQHGFGWAGLLARLALMAAAAMAVALADDETQPAPAPSTQATPAPAAPAPTPATTGAASAPAKKPATGKSDQNSDDSGDYEKNAAKRFIPTERTPADRNVSFPVDI
jgi:hypothetical protein